GTARTWDAGTGEPRLVVGDQARPSRPSRASGAVAALTRPPRYPVPARAVSAVAFSPDGTVIATGSDDGTARTWDVGTGEPRLVLTERFAFSGVTQVAFSPDGTLIATAC